MTRRAYYVPMRKPKGKLVALLAGAVAVPLLTLAVLFWKDVYCHLFLDPRLVGRWECTELFEPGEFLEFDRIGNTTFGFLTGSYSAEGSELTFFPDGNVSIGDGPKFMLGTDVLPYQLSGGNLLTFSGLTFLRVPDDS